MQGRALAVDKLASLLSIVGLLSTGCGARTGLESVGPSTDAFAETPEAAIDARPAIPRDDVSPPRDTAPDIAPDTSPDVPAPCAPGCTTDLDLGLVAYWKLEGNGLDATGGGSDLAPWPKGTPSWTTGKLGQGLYPKLCDTSYLCENATSLATATSPRLQFDAPTADFTVSLWARRTKSLYADATWWGYALLENGQVSVGAWGSGAGGSPAFPTVQLWRAGAPFATLQDNTFDWRSPTNTDDWVHVIAFRRDTVLGLRINGHEVTMSVSGSVGSASMFHVAEQASGYPWQGSVDEVGKWNRALSCCEMDALYAGGAGRALP